jgi:hypothetical protein
MSWLSPFADLLVSEPSARHEAASNDSCDSFNVICWPAILEGQIAPSMSCLDKSFSAFRLKLFNTNK